ncbi:MAG: cyclic nucleotide-binding protein, partial [Solirubrobacterales bacterium]
MSDLPGPIGAGDAETPDRDGAFPRLSAEQRARLRGLGSTRRVEAGEILFKAGDRGADFFVVESGAVAIVQ